MRAFPQTVPALVLFWWLCERGRPSVLSWPLLRSSTCALYSERGVWANRWLIALVNCTPLWLLHKHSHLDWEPNSPAGFWVEEMRWFCPRRGQTLDSVETHTHTHTRTVAQQVLFARLKPTRLESSFVAILMSWPPLRNSPRPSVILSRLPKASLGFVLAMVSEHHKLERLWVKAVCFQVYKSDYHVVGREKMTF